MVHPNCVAVDEILHKAGARRLVFPTTFDELIALTAGEPAQVA